MKKIYHLIIVIGTLLVSVPSFAQKTSTQPVKWSFDAQALYGVLYNNNKLGGGNLGVHGGATAMVIPQLGFRAGIQLGSVRGIKDDAEWKFDQKRAIYGSIALDILWDIRRTFSQRSDLKYLIQPFLRISTHMGIGNSTLAMSMGVGGGIRQVFGINRHLGIVWDLNAVVMNERPWRDVSGYMLLGQTAVGISYAL